MNIQTKDFKNALEMVKPGISIKENIEQSSHFAITNQKIFSYNDELAIMCPVVGLDIEGAIEASELYAFIGKVDSESLELTQEENQLLIKAGNSKTGIILKPEILLPLNDKQLNERGKWKNLPNDFSEAIDFVSESCSTSIENPVTMCVHINSKGFVEGTDTYRLSHWQLDEVLEVENVLIPASSIKVIYKFKPIKIANGDGWVHFKNRKEATLSCRCFNKPYINTDKVLAKPAEKGIKVKFPDKLLNVIERAQVFAERPQKSFETITISVKKGKLFVASQSETGSWFRESLPIDYTGENFEFMVTPYMLKNILKQMNECTIYSNHLRFKNKNWVHIASLKVSVQ